MSEFSESFSVSKLIGAPAGYVGYRERTQLTDQIKYQSHGILLFDEMEKAHEDVQNLLLHMLEEGAITDATGHKIYLHHFLIIFTTTMEASFFTPSAFGFQTPSLDPKKENFTHLLREELQELFLPELLNRLEAICPFPPLSPSSLKQIAKKHLDQWKSRLLLQDISLRLDHSVIEYMIKASMESDSGAREMECLIEKEIEPLLMAYLLPSFDQIKQFSLKYRDQKFVLTPVYAKSQSH
jgi:ATP-dependent Clp protease ATP-binding subunit ClpA